MTITFKRTKGPHERNIDEHIGKRIRMARHIQGISQSKLAERLGSSFQQIQKYEKSLNRISASRLWSISNALNLPMNFFFEDLPESLSINPFTNNLNNPLERSDVLELVASYIKLQRNFPLTANKFLELLQQTASSSLETEKK